MRSLAIWSSVSFALSCAVLVAPRPVRAQPEPAPEQVPEPPEAPAPEEEAEPPPEDGPSEPACVPDCRAGFGCVSGTCVSACNPPCPDGQECTAEARCVPVAPTVPPIVEPAPPTRAPVAQTRDVEPSPAPPDPDPAARLHEGFYLRMALGVGFIHDSVDIEGFERPEELSGLGPLIEVLAGGTPLRGLVLGGGFVWLKLGNARREVGGRPVDPEPGDPAKLDVRATAIVAFADYYLDPEAGFHGQALLGLGWGNLTNEDGDEAYDGDAQGPALGLGVGYDLWVADQWSLGLLARAYYLRLAADVDPEEHNAVTAFAVMFSATNH